MDSFKTRTTLCHPYCNHLLTIYIYGCSHIHPFALDFNLRFIDHYSPSQFRFTINMSLHLLYQFLTASWLAPLKYPNTIDVSLKDKPKWYMTMVSAFNQFDFLFLKKFHYVLMHSLPTVAFVIPSPFWLGVKEMVLLQL